MNDWPIEVAASGGVVLGPSVVCDGFLDGYPIRAQSHVHSDHMEDFDRSKGFQDIYMLRATRRLLEVERNADLPYRSNIVDVLPGEVCDVPEAQLVLERNGHMLGSAQVLVEMNSGTRLGYSGDFQWPMDDPIQVDFLVVDSTYGSPNSVREYSLDEVEESLLALVRRRLAFGPVHIKAFRGTVLRALEVLSREIECPVLASSRLIRDSEVYRQFGYTTCDLIDVRSADGKAIALTNRFIRLYSAGDAEPVDIGDGSAILLSAFMAEPSNPCLQYTDRSYRLAMSDHADFNGTLEYVKATGARFVVTDNCRGSHGVELAIEIQRRLLIEARPSSSIVSNLWGS